MFQPHQLLLSIEFWSFNRGPYNGLTKKVPIWLGSISSPTTPPKTRSFSLLRWADFHLHFKLNSPRFRKPCKCRGIPIAHDLPICGCNVMIWDIHPSASAHQRTSCIGPLPTAVLVAVCSIFMPSVACAARTEPRSRPRQPIVSGPHRTGALR